LNRRFAEECYLSPLSWNLNATIRKPKVLGIVAALLPDGVPANTTTGLIWMQGVWIDPDA
jgi:hypothetical protein